MYIMKEDKKVNHSGDIILLYCGIDIHSISYHLYAMHSREIVNHEGLTMVSHVGLTYGCHEGHTIIMSHHMGH